jgi:hypothetical protein
MNKNEGLYKDAILVLIENVFRRLLDAIESSIQFRVSGALYLQLYLG